MVTTLLVGATSMFCDLHHSQSSRIVMKISFKWQIGIQYWWFNVKSSAGFYFDLYWE